jgi:chromosome segregation ATPase
VAGKTHGDRLLELETNVSRLGERVESIREQIGGLPEFGTRVTAIDQRIEGVRIDFVRLNAELNAVVGRVQEISDKRLTLEQIDPASFRDRLKELEVKLEHLEKQRSEEHGKTWAIKLAVVSALIGSVFTVLTQLLSKYLPVK